MLPQNLGYVTATHLGKRLIQQYCPIPVIVTRKKFITALSGEHRFDMRACQLRNEIKRNARREFQRFVFVPNEFRESLKELIWLDHNLMMFGTDIFCHFTRIAKLAVIISFISYCKSLDRLDNLLCSHSCNQTGIYTAAKEYSQRHITDEVKAHRLFQ